jgi:hypothetical protein
LVLKLDYGYSIVERKISKRGNEMERTLSKKVRKIGIGVLLAGLVLVGGAFGSMRYAGSNLRAYRQSHPLYVKGDTTFVVQQKVSMMNIHAEKVGQVAIPVFVILLLGGILIGGIGVVLIPVSYVIKK